MTFPELWNAGWTAPLFNHLWQSTVVLLVAWLLTLALRRNPARVRYAIWMLASMKFLVPFALLANLGSHWAWPFTERSVGSALYTAIDEVGQPFQASIATAPHELVSAHPVSVLAFVPIALASIWLCGIIVALTMEFLCWRRVARIARAARPFDKGRELEALRRAESNAGLRKPIPLRVSSRGIEPGVFGIFRPLLLWPAGISEHLDDAQIDSIVAHEVEHVRRRDNLTAAIHLLVEALFWFHPAVRWMGARLLDERERACDEKVLENNARPETYAESILKVCTFCLEPPASCVAGVSGSDLKQRIVRIMTHRSGVGLTLVRKALLGAAAGLAIVLPVGFGVLHAMQASATSSVALSDVSADVPKYEVATIKPSPADTEGRLRLMFTPDGTQISGAPLQLIVRDAFGVQEDRIIGLPGWAKTNRYDIQAKVAPEDAPKLEKLKMDQRASMLVPVLEERFSLKYHHEMRELPSYALVVARGGPKLKMSAVTDLPADFKPPVPGDDSKAGGPGGGARVEGSGPNPSRGHMVHMMGPGRIEAEGSEVQILARILSQQLGRTVVDKTGLTGNYDYALTWTPDTAPPPMPGGGPEGGPPHNEIGNTGAGPSLLTALQEQLGLKLESEKGKVDVIVIDHIDTPSEN
jgi:uncharacterized protein (TIGR03435 family)